MDLILFRARTAKVIKEQVGGVVDEEEWRQLGVEEAEQRALTEFIEEEPG